MRKKLTIRQKLEKAKNRLNKLTEKRNRLITEKKNTYIRAKEKARLNFDWVVKTKQGIKFKARGTREIVQTDRKQISLGKDPDEWEKYQKTEEKIKDTNEKLWETQKKIRRYEERKKKEQEKEDRDWEKHYLKNVVSYVKKNGVNRHLIDRSINVYLRTMGNAMMAKQERQGQVKGFRGSWLKYNRGRG